jgi:very-short-patch-repair endonuclease
MSIARSRSLRRKMSPAEARLWNMLRSEPLKAHHFRRQVEIGPYYADFASLRDWLVIEVDGRQHFEDEAVAYDARRDAVIRASGYRIVRVTSSDVLNRIEGVYDLIVGVLSDSR